MFTRRPIGVDSPLQIYFIKLYGGNFPITVRKDTLNSLDRVSNVSPSPFAKTASSTVFVLRKKVKSITAFNVETQDAASLQKPIFPFLVQDPHPIHLQFC